MSLVFAGFDTETTDAGQSALPVQWAVATCRKEGAGGTNPPAGGGGVS